MVETIAVSKTLELQVVSAGKDSGVRIDRHDGGLIWVSAGELRSLVAGLVAAAVVLAGGLSYGLYKVVPANTSTWPGRRVGTPGDGAPTRSGLGGSELGHSGRAWDGGRIA